MRPETDFILNGKAHGGVAARLLTANMDPMALRDNTLLRHEEWITVDEAVLKVSRQRLTGFNDLISRGLVHDLKNGMGATVLAFETVGDLTEAAMSMDGVTRSPADRLNFTPGYLPLPIIHKDFGYTARALAVSRNLGQPLDTAHAEAAARKVAEYAENILFNGASSYSFGGGTLYGYTDFPSRLTGNLTAAWDGSGVTGANILDDVLAMIQAAHGKRRYGPFVLYVPTAYDARLQDDFKTNSDRTIKERLLAIDAIEEVKAADKLSAGNVVLAEMSADTVRAVVGMQPTAVQWEEQGGMQVEMKVMAILVPQIRADQEGSCGVVHYSAP